MSKKFDKNLIKDLEVLGLNEKEAIVYMDLLGRVTPTGTSKIGLVTGLHGQYIYNALETLEQKGLVKHSVINGRKKFEANSPQRLSHLIDAKRLIANRVTDQLLMLASKPTEQSFEVYQGNSSFIQHEIDMANSTSPNSTWYVISSQEKKFTEIMGDSMDELTDTAKKKNINTKTIGVREDILGLAKINKLIPNHEYKILPGLKEGATSIVIREDNVSFESFEPVPLCYTIHNKLVAENYKNLFEILWGFSSDKEKGSDW